MITSDLLRAVFVAAMCLVEDRSQLTWLYALLLLQVCTTVFFNAAKAAALPNTVPREHLHTAYAMSAAAWSTMLSIGSVLGAILLDAFGRRTVFLIDAGTYLLSAWILLGLTLPTNRAEGRLSIRGVLFFEDIRHALAHVRQRGFLPILFVKTFWGGCGGFLVMLSVVGTERFGHHTGIFSGPSAPAVTGFATGLLYAARGVGTGVGPILCRHLFGSSDSSLLRQISGGFVVGGVAYALFAEAQILALAAGLVVVGHLGGSALWIASTTLWQHKTDDQFRGRVHSLDFLGMTLGFTAGGFLAGGLYDHLHSINWTLRIVSLTVIVSGLVWTSFARRLFVEARA